MKRRLLCAQIAVLAAMAGCAPVSGSKSRPTAAVTLQALARSIPMPDGCEGQAVPSFFDRENLYKAIDGMAPEYVGYGCVGLAMLEWPVPKQPGEKVQVEVYDMGSARGAFGIYSRSHVGEGEFVDVGEEAAVDEGAVEFARQRFYVRLLGPLDSRSVLESLAKMIVALVPPGPRPDELLTTLPRDGRLPRSGRWIPEAAFGMEFMRDVWVARYRLEEAELELYVAPFPDPAAARSALDKFRTAVAKRKPTPSLIAFPGFEYNDEWIGRVGVFQVGRRLVVVVGSETKDAVAGLLGKVASLPDAGTDTASRTARGANTGI